MSGGALWRSGDGIDWSIVQRFATSVPVAIGVYGGAVYVGAEGANGRGVLWGPAPPAGAGSALTGDLPLWPAATPEPLQGAALAALDRTLEDPAALGASHRVQAMLRLCFDGPVTLDDPPRPLGEALARAVDPDQPDGDFAAVRARLSELLARLHAAYERVLGAEPVRQDASCDHGPKP